MFFYYSFVAVALSAAAVATKSILFHERPMIVFAASDQTQESQARAAKQVDLHNVVLNQAGILLPYCVGLCCSYYITSLQVSNLSKLTAKQFPMSCYD